MTKHPVWPEGLLEQLTHDAAAGGFTGKRIDAKNSRWVYLKKLLSLGKQYAEVLSRS